MRSRRVQCPFCHAILAAPPGCANCIARCSRCNHRFKLPRRVPVTEEAVVDWLAPGMEKDEIDLDATLVPKGRPTDDPVSHQTAVLPTPGAAVHLTELSSAGATFVFPAKLLRSEKFRLSLPRRCLRCGSRSGLVAHVVVFSPELRDSFSVEAEHAAGTLCRHERQLAGLSGADLLGALPQVPNVPAPANLPMPYWLCTGCSGAGQIGGHIQVASDDATGGWCRLRIRSLRRAEEFLVAAGGGDTHDHAELRKQLTSLRDDPWNSLPGAVQNRIKQWYRPHKGERFVGFVPDDDLVASELGMGGLVVTNCRLIIHSERRHHECLISNSIQLQWLMGNSKGRLRIKAPQWEVKHVALDRAGASALRQALREAKFQTVWT
jgi:hypothetical protein